MDIVELEIPGLKLFKFKVFEDERGFFVERYNKKSFEKLGFVEDFVQDNFSRSNFKVLRGLHFQYELPQGKLVSCLRGKIVDYVVDLRTDQKSFGKSFSIELEGHRPQAFWIPPGFAHGFVVTSPEGADVHYKTTCIYNSSGEGTILWCDPELKIDWGIKDPQLSTKDKQAGSFSDYRRHFANKVWWERK